MTYPSIYTKNLDLLVLAIAMAAIVYVIGRTIQRYSPARQSTRAPLLSSYLTLALTLLVAHRVGERVLDHHTRDLSSLARSWAAEVEARHAGELQPGAEPSAGLMALLARVPRHNELIADIYLLGLDSAGAPIVLADGPDDRDRDGDWEAARERGSPIAWSAESQRAFLGTAVATRAPKGEGGWLSAYAPIPLPGDRRAVLVVDSPASHWVHDVWVSRAIVGAAGLLVLAIGLLALHNLRTAEARRDREDRDQARERFLATVSHELRTPLNGIIGLTELLRESDLRADHADMVRTVHSSARAMVRLVNDLLDLSKLSAGKLSLEDESFRPLDIVTDVAAQERVQAAAKGLTLRVTTEGPVDVMIVSDPIRFRQILANLVNNAVKYTQRGEVCVHLAQRFEQADRLTVTLNVTDTGIGIPPELADRLFQPFERAQGAARAQAGSGLGLSVAHELAARLGGTLAFTSRPGQGSTFTFRFQRPLSLLQPTDSADDGSSESTGRPPLIFATDGPPLQPAQSALNWPPRQAGARPRVLVAEDNPVNQRVVRMQLEKLGVEVDVAPDGREAMRACRSKAYALVLMDLSMPELDGIEATRAIRNMTNGHQPTILALTASVTDSDQRRCERAGMNGFLQKPLTSSALRKALVTWIPGYSPPAQLLTLPPKEPEGV